MTRRRSPRWCAIKGIGRWSAEIYLLFAEGRPDIWPAGDLAVQIEVGRLLGLPERPSETGDAPARRRLAAASRRGGDLRLASLWQRLFGRGGQGAALTGAPN